MDEGQANQASWINSATGKRKKMCVSGVKCPLKLQFPHKYVMLKATLQYILLCQTPFAQITLHYIKSMKSGSIG